MKIICARCQKQVEEVRTWQDIPTGDHIIQAHCHGERDEMRVPTRALRNHEYILALDTAIQRGGIAFQTEATGHE